MLVISELVTNALRHGLGDVVVRASVDDHTAVRVSVTDSGAEQPRLLPPDPRRTRWRRPAHRRRHRRVVGRVAFPGGKTAWAVIAPPGV